MVKKHGATAGFIQGALYHAYPRLDANRETSTSPWFGGKWAAPSVSFGTDSIGLFPPVKKR